MEKKEEMGLYNLTEVLCLNDTFENFQLDPEKHETIVDFISEFDYLKVEMEAKGTRHPEEIWAIKLIRKAGCDQRESMALMSQLDLTHNLNIYNSAKEALTKYRCDYQGDIKQKKETDCDNVFDSKDGVLDALKVEINDDIPDFDMPGDDFVMDEETFFSNGHPSASPNNDKDEESKPKLKKTKKKNLDHDVKPANGDKVKRRRAPKNTEKKEPQWFKDPSPERWVDGKKVKYICVTQENLAEGPPYLCIAIDCKYKSNLIINVKKHYRMHSNEKPFGCKVCGKKFSTSNTVDSHWNRKHNKNWVKEFSCDACGLQFPSQPELMRHRVVHSGEMFACNVCGKEFNSPWKRDAHELRHKQEKVPCPICGKNFASLRDAERHQVRHEGARNFECEICGKKSKTGGDLRVHKQIMHSQNEDSECPECGKIFKLKRYLDNHIKRVHERSTLFRCLLCPQVLSTKQHFKRHSMRCHDGQRIPVSNRVT